MTPPARTIHARTDAGDRLVAADEPLAGLQARAGGELPGSIASPALLELVRRSRAYGLKLARSIEAQDGDRRITAWAEIEPVEGEGGCSIQLTNWKERPVEDDAARHYRSAAAALAEHLSGLSVRLGREQEILAVDEIDPELSDLAAKFREARGEAWTKIVELDGVRHAKPVHWRLLDGAGVKVEGAPRRWTARLVPHGRPVEGSDGFDLFLVADSPAPEAGSAPDRGERLGKALQGIGREIAPILRQPVARIIANAETINTQMAGPLAEEYSAYAADISSAGEHLLALIDDLTTLEMIEDEQFAPAPDRIDLADLARRAAGILGVRARERGIAIDLPKNGENAPAIGEFRRVLQILLNLLGNAIRYSPEGADVWLRVETMDGRSRVIVADQGEGLDKTEQKRAFRKFERLGRSGDGGSGLGLYISRTLAEAMDGTLTVESAKGQGARFVLDLPADPEAGGQP